VSQLETLEKIFTKLNQIYSKLCEIETLLQQEDKIVVDIPLFFGDDGSIKEDYSIQSISGDASSVSRLNEVYSGIVEALRSYASEIDQTWEVP